MDIEAMASTLLAHPDFQVLRRFQPFQGAPAPEGVPVAKGIILDTETTGTDPQVDKMVEIALVAFDFCPDTGKIYQVTGVYNGLEAPGMPMPPVVTEINGITDAMLAGQQFDDAAVESMIQGVTLVIAHNSKFDRPFVEARFPQFITMAWGCSLKQVDWSGEGYSSAKLEWLAYKLGFFYAAHRAEIDCQVLLSILNRPLPKSGDLPLQQILKASQEPDYTVYAIDAGYAVKDLLKARGYQWDPEEKVWHIDRHGRDATAQENQWLLMTIYRREQVTLQFAHRDASSRFSSREPTRATREVALTPENLVLFNEIRQNVRPADPAGQ